MQSILILLHLWLQMAVICQLPICGMGWLFMLQYIYVIKVFDKEFFSISLWMMKWYRYWKKWTEKERLIRARVTHAVYAQHAMHCIYMYIIGKIQCSLFNVFYFLTINSCIYIKIVAIIYFKWRLITLISSEVYFCCRNIFRSFYKWTNCVSHMIPHQIKH